MSVRSVSISTATMASVLMTLLIINSPCVSSASSSTSSRTNKPVHMFVSISDQDRALPGHVQQADVEAGKWSIDELNEAGQLLFITRFTRADGQGRPGATGNNSPTRRPLRNAPEFIRTAGPDANSCFACHNSPAIGGAGDIVANVFVGAGDREPVFSSVDPRFSAERNTTSMYGSGVIELLAREMTAELHKIRKDVKGVAKSKNEKTRRRLIAKGVDFGFITSDPDGSLHLNEVDGVDRDLVVRPWSRKGVVTSLRTFSVNAMNLHHGMEAHERFGTHLTGSNDFDRDSIVDELTEGDITAVTVFQATLPIPGRVLPNNSDEQKEVERGERQFSMVGCASCHMPNMNLTSVDFTEPGPYNLEGTLRRSDVKNTLKIDLSKDGPGPHLVKNAGGGAVVHPFTDLKRHTISDKEDRFFADETEVQGFASTAQFITTRLWDVGNTGPYGHKGNLSTIREAILHHAGEARPSRMAYSQLPKADQEAIVSFLRTLQILPLDSPVIVYKEPARKLPYATKK